MLIATVLLMATGCGASRQSTGLSVPSDWSRPAAIAPRTTPVVAPASRYAVLMHAGWLLRDLAAGQDTPDSLAALGQDAYALQVDGVPPGVAVSYWWELAAIRATAEASDTVATTAARYAIARVSAVAVLRQLAASTAVPAA